MEVRQKDFNGHRVLFLSGELDLACVREIRELILASIDSGRHLAIDFSQVGYIDSSGIASLVEGFQRSRLADQGFTLLQLSDPVRKVIELARLDQVFEILDDADSLPVR